MERKIGEIFEYNGEWYQCVEDTTDDNCNNCCLQKSCPTISGNCASETRSDGESVAFKKLKKVGEPYDFQKRTFQTYKLHMTPFLSEDVELVAVPSKDNNTIEIEIKQTKEDMEEKKIQHYDCFFDWKSSKSNLKPFDLKAAKAGKPVCTRDGKKARIICFDTKSSKPIIALIKRKYDDYEENYSFYENGRVCRDKDNDYDLMMLPEKKEGWVNVYKRENEYICENECNVSTGIAVYKSEGEAKRNIDKNKIYVNTIKITWEE